MTKVYCADITPLFKEEVYKKHYENTSPERRAKADKLKYVQDKALCICAGILINEGLKEYGLKEKDIKYGYGKNGKPYFCDVPKLHFNLSHSTDKVIVAFSDREVGCDIEKVSDADLSVAKRFFTQREYETVNSFFQDKDKADAFFRIWTIKESFIKATGLGAELPLDSFEVNLSDNSTITQKADNNKYYICEPEIFCGYKSAVCLTEGQDELSVINVKIDV